MNTIAKTPPLARWAQAPEGVVCPAVFGRFVDAAGVSAGEPLLEYRRSIREYTAQK